MITWENIIAKIGFDPREGFPERRINSFEDDTQPSLYAKLDWEELDWLCQQMFHTGDDENGYSPVPRKKE